jgi:hypothetical protein
MSNSTTPPLVSTLAAIQLRMSYIVMPTLLVFGSGGNILNTLIFLQKTLRSSSCSMYMMAAYILYTFILCFAMSTSLYALNNRDPLTYNEAYCKIRQYLISSILTMARCCVGMACVDRYAISSQSVKTRSFGRPRVARYIITIIIVMWLILASHLVILNTIQNGKCVMPGDYSYFYAGYAIVGAGIIPPGMMVTFTILAAKNIRQLRRRVQPTHVDRNHNANVNIPTNANTGVHLKQHDYQLLKMLMVDITIYCSSAVPAPIYYVYAAITLKSPKTPEQVAWQTFFNFFTYQVLLYTAASTSFYTNFLVSKAFRNELRLFLSRYFPNKRPLIMNSSTNKVNNNTIPGGLATVKSDVRLAVVQT